MELQHSHSCSRLNSVWVRGEQGQYVWKKWCCGNEWNSGDHGSEKTQGFGDFFFVLVGWGVLGFFFVLVMFIFSAVPDALEVAGKTNAQLGSQHFESCFWHCGRTDLMTYFPLWYMRNSCISWPLMLSLSTMGCFAQPKLEKANPLQFPMNFIAATVKLPILRLCKTHVTVKIIKAKSTESGGPALFNCAPVFSCWSREWAEKSWSRKQKCSQMWQGGLSFILRCRTANFSLGKQWEEALSAVALLCVPLDLILMQIEKGICS